MESTAAGHDELDYVGGGLPKTTNWWGAFVIGLAGTILVTGIAPVMVTSLGAVAIRHHIAEKFDSMMYYGGLTYSSHPVSLAASISRTSASKSRPSSAQ